MAIGGPSTTPLPHQHREEGCRTPSFPSPDLHAFKAREVGADLLHRSTRKVSLSIEGAEFLPYAREILAQQDAALAALGHGNAEVTGRLRFAASSTFAALYILPHLPEFLSCYPGVDLDLRLSDKRADLIEGGFDLALRNFAISDSTLIGRKLANDRRVLCASPAYLDRFGVPLTPQDLEHHQLLGFANAKSRTLVSSSQRSCTFPPTAGKHRIICDDGTSLKALTLAGLGISMGSIWSLHTDLKSGQLVQVLTEYEVDDGSAIWLVYPKSNVLTAKVRVFIDFLVGKVGSPPVWERSSFQG